MPPRFLLAPHITFFFIMYHTLTIKGIGLVRKIRGKHDTRNTIHLFGILFIFHYLFECAGWLLDCYWLLVTKYSLIFMLVSLLGM